MTDSKHTPGPWTFTIENDDRYIRAGGDSMMCDTPYYPYCPSGDANWHLIAAAPDLLECLRELYAIVRGECPSLLNEDSGGNAELEMAIIDAIAKAEGRASPLPADNGRAE